METNFSIIFFWFIASNVSHSITIYPRTVQGQSLFYSVIAEIFFSSSSYVLSLSLFALTLNTHNSFRRRSCVRYSILLIFSYGRINVTITYTRDSMPLIHNFVSLGTTFTGEQKAHTDNQPVLNIMAN